MFDTVSMCASLLKPFRFLAICLKRGKEGDKGVELTQFSLVRGYTMLLRRLMRNNFPNLIFAGHLIQERFSGFL
jgi:hypothetical protein